MIVEQDHDFVPAHPGSGGKNDWCTKCGRYITEHNEKKEEPKKIEKLMLDFDTQAQVENVTYKINEIIDYLDFK